MDISDNVRVAMVDLFIVLVLFINKPMIKSASLDITTDKEALLSFKSRVSEEHRPNPLSNWDENSSPCNWTGVSCNERGQWVIGLNLSGLSITGPISPRIGNLSFLRSLELQNNRFVGSLPDEIGYLLHLQMLNLSFNNIRGAIPFNISQCRELRIIDLKQNQISGCIPQEITNLRQLQVLILAGNQISGELPKSLSNMSSLVDLDLGTNKISGTIPSDFARLENLKFLDLSINNLSDIVPPSIYNMSSLVYLGLASNNLRGDLPGDIGLKLPNLLKFYFCFNRFTGCIPWSLHNLTNIRIIRMAHNLLHGTIPPGLGTLPYLETYNIRSNSIMSSGQKGLDFLESLTNSTHLKFLAFDSNLLEGLIPQSIGNLSKVLAKLYMGGNNIYGTIPSSIGELKGLELVDFSLNSISGEIPSEIGQLKELRVLGLADNMLSGIIPSSLGNLQLLTKIDLSKNELVGSIPITFGNFQELISVDLSHNQLNGSIPREVFNLPRLSAFLNMSQNQLSGTLPLEIKLLDNAVIIDISDNRLSGNIPDSVGECLSLEQLLLARNMLSGRIPKTLDFIRGLEIIDLSSNQLDGEIPSSLQNMQSLQYLNLSFNKLVGRVPSGGIFKDSSKFNLENNQDLCHGSSCEGPYVLRRQFNFAYIILCVSLIVSISIAIGLACYLRRGRANVMDSFELSMENHQNVSYNDIRLTTDNFNEQNLIGKGSSGNVYKGILQGSEVAIKVLDAAVARTKKSFQAECTALRHVRHRNLVKLITICSSIDSKNQEFLALIFEFMSNGSLDDWLKGKRMNADEMGLTLSQRLSSAIGIASALDYLHNETEAPIVHCDIKPSNILLDSDMNPKVADFGLAKTLTLNANSSRFSLSSTRGVKGSIGYIPPEYGYGGKPSMAGDVYSYGILLLELFTGKSPTHDMFNDGSSLRSWVLKEFPKDLERVLDPNLLHEFKVYRDQDGLINIFRLGLQCTAASPDARINIREALHKLNSVEVAVSLGSHI